MRRGLVDEKLLAVDNASVVQYHWTCLNYCFQSTGGLLSRCCLAIVDGPAIATIASLTLSRYTSS